MANTACSARGLHRALLSNIKEFLKPVNIRNAFEATTQAMLTCGRNV